MHFSAMIALRASLDVFLLKEDFELSSKAAKKTEVFSHRVLTMVNLGITLGPLFCKVEMDETIYNCVQPAASSTQHCECCQPLHASIVFGEGQPDGPPVNQNWGRQGLYPISYPSPGGCYLSRGGEYLIGANSKYMLFSNC